MPPRSSSITIDPKSHSFLGREFLTWLWFRCEMDGGTFELPAREGGDPEEVGVVFNDYVSLVSCGDDREENIVRKGSPHRSAEARTALLVGKSVAAAKLEIASGDRSFAVTLNGETLDLRSLRYPSAAADEPADRTLERLDAMREIGEIVDGLYATFLAVRTTPAWDEEEVPAIERWIRKRAQGRAEARADG